MPSGGVTGVLRRWAEGDAGAIDELTPLVYSELCRLAQHHLRHKREGHSLQSVELVHEAYLRLVDQKARPMAGLRATQAGIRARIVPMPVLPHFLASSS